MKRTILSFILIASILGCTSIETTDTNISLTKTSNGLSIVSFNSFLNQLIPGDANTLTLVVANGGEGKAENITATLFNFGSGFQNITPETIDMNGYLATNSGVKGLYLNPEDSASFIWEIKAKNRDVVKATTTYSPKARVCYSYSTYSIADLFLTDKLWKGTLPTLSSSSTKSPVEIQITSRAPIRGNTINESLTFDVTFPDSSSGYIAEGNGAVVGKRDYLQSFSIKIPKGDSNIEVVDLDLVTNTITQDSWSCSINSNSYECFISNPNDLYLVQGKSRKFRIAFDTLNIPSSDFEQTYKIEATAVYKHCITTETSPVITILVEDIY